MAYDLIIKNGTVIDGTGAFRRRADVAVKDGKVAEIGKVTDGAAETIDASDLIVSPGFVDPHTHYDAQICWDPLVSCTSWHGVTTVVMGNCGVGIAPCKPAAREVAAWDLVNVEAIPFEALSKGITWEWETLSGIHRGGRASRRGNQSRVPGAADSVSALRAGRRVDGARGDARRDGARRGAAARGGRRGRVRIFDDDAAAAYRLPGTSAGMPAGVDAMS